MNTEIFNRDTEKSVEVINRIMSKLSHKVENEYRVNSHRSILSGEIASYSEKFLNERNLSQDSKEIDNVIDLLVPMFQRAVNWGNPGTMLNIVPPVNVVSVAASSYASLFNPNLGQDETSGYLISAELLTAKYLSQLVGWDWKQSSGIFTFGGKGTNLYALKLGLNKAFGDDIQSGGISSFENNKAIVISTDKGHPCHKEVCDWLGLGTNSFKKIATTSEGTINLEELEKTLREAIEHDTKIACIYVNGGTSNEIIVDPIDKVVELRDKLVAEYKLTYKPHIHVDAVIGWAWLFFKEYDFATNSLGMSEIELLKVKSLTDKISKVELADSFGADFHKTGFCPYVSSIFMVKDGSEVTNIGKQKFIPKDELKFGEYAPFLYTLELSRSISGPIAAYSALETLGIKGFQELIYNCFSNGEYIRNYLNSNSEIEVINNDSEGIASLLVVKKKDDNRNFEEIVMSSSEELQEFLEYNNQFYLFCLQELEKFNVNFKLTFSKSYKPHGVDSPTGAIKIYPNSPISTKEEISSILEEFITAKAKFDNLSIHLSEEWQMPDDFIYRN
ncbi:hypothetical protein JNE33_10565 [Streptococcus suis]|uniref:pyridoxal phosphate-dependent decarboxylase family protein n=1 Tax=Streptococcus suis TaxID=1307 RepID=UPI00192E27CA|nr:pyridoxal-dependent decarboxylase [Streptococcus suis]MBL6440923.1 hypothetical protein [Streptococcus suis]